MPIIMKESHPSVWIDLSRVIQLVCGRAGFQAHVSPEAVFTISPSWAHGRGKGQAKGVWLPTPLPAQGFVGARCRAQEGQQAVSGCWRG